MTTHPPEESSPFADDTDREIARMLIAGEPNKVIARSTGLALGTVKWRLHRMYTRLGVHSRTAFAISVQGLLNGAP